MSRHDCLAVREYLDDNALRHWTEITNPLRFVVNGLVVMLAQYMPIRVKNAMYRLVGVDVGPDVAIGMKAILDPFNPDQISIGAGSTIGYRTTILTHEATPDELREGPVEIGEDVLVGTNSTVLPGVTIGDGATVSAHTLVNRDVPPDTAVGGVPMREIELSGDSEPE